MRFQVLDIVPHAPHPVTEDRHFPMFGLELGHQYEYLTENYELLRRLLREERVSWIGRHHADLHDVTTYPRPFNGPNALQPRRAYQVLIDRYRAKLVENGHDPSVGYVGAGSGGLFLADTDDEAVAQYRPLYEAMAAKLAAAHAGDDRKGKTISFTTIEDAVAHGPALVGTPAGVAAKIVD